jgi:integrase
LAWRSDTPIADPTFGLLLPKKPEVVHRALTPEQVARLFSVCADNRERLVVSLGVQEGLRAGEQVRLELGDIDRKNGWLLIRGKGNKQREVPLTDETAALIDAYLEEWPPPRTGTLLRSYHDGASPLSANWAIGVGTSVFSRAGLKRYARDGMSLHACRHTAATDVAEKCKDPYVVQEFLGHASVDTGRIYVKRAARGPLAEAVRGRTYR